MVIENLFCGAEGSEMIPETVVYADGSSSKGACPIVSEHAMDLFLNEQLTMKLVCTPSNLTELVVGRLISEGYIQSAEDVDMLYICGSGHRARVFLNDAASEALKLIQTAEEVPTCCTDNRVILRNRGEKEGESGTAEMQRMPDSEWKPEWIFSLANAFVSGSRIHKQTQGTHGCYLSVGGALHFTAEDIGRHNAVDKAIGYAVLQGLAREDCILYTTGRVSTDMARKVIMARIPVLVSKSVPTEAAVRLARAYNLTLICKAWPDRFEIFNGAGVECLAGL